MMAVIQAARSWPDTSASTVFLAPPLAGTRRVTRSHWMSTGSTCFRALTRSDWKDGGGDPSASGEAAAGSPGAPLLPMADLVTRPLVDGFHQLTSSGSALSACTRAYVHTSVWGQGAASEGSGCAPRRCWLPVERG